MTTSTIANRPPIESKNGLTQLLSTTIQDWRLAYDSDIDNIDPERRGQYTLLVELHDDTKQLYVSIHDKAFAEHFDISAFGLNAIFEIREGMPALSVGISPDDSIVHLISNTSNELAIINDDSRDKPLDTPVDFIESEFRGLCYYRDDFGNLSEARYKKAESEFEAFDFNGHCVKDDSAWDVSEQYWTKNVFIENQDCTDSIKVLFRVTFGQTTAFVASVTCDGLPDKVTTPNKGFGILQGGTHWLHDLGDGLSNPVLSKGIVNAWAFESVNEASAMIAGTAALDDALIVVLQ